MSYLQERLFRLFQPSKTLEALAVQVEDLRHVVNSATHDIAVLKTVLENNGLMNEAVYKELRIGRMLSDHGGPGAAPWKGMSVYPYTLDENDFLHETLGATEAEVREFREDASSRQTMT